VDHPAALLKDAMTDADAGRIAQPATRDGVLPCFTTDQVSEHYQKVMTVMTYVSIPVGLTVLGIAAYVIRRTRKEGKALRGVENGGMENGQ